MTEWLVYSAVAAASFTALEVYFLATRGPRSTFSAWIRRVGGIDPWKWYGALTRVGLIAAAALLVGHLGWAWPV